MMQVLSEKEVGEIINQADFHPLQLRQPQTPIEGE